MDIGTAMVGTVMVAACILPFVLMAQNRKKRQKAHLFSLNKMVESQQSKIDEHEFCNNAVIGLDRSKKQLFYYQQGNNKDIRRAIDLTQAKMCQSEIEYANPVAGTSCIQKLHLVFTGEMGQQNQDTLNLYNAEEQSDLQGELVLQQNWEKKINELLSNRQ